MPLMAIQVHGASRAAKISPVDLWCIAYSSNHLAQLSKKKTNAKKHLKHRLSAYEHMSLLFVPFRTWTLFGDMSLSAFESVLTS
jgi:hypothetical protein